MALFSRLKIRIFQLIFSAGTLFFSKKNQLEQYFSLFFSISVRGLSLDSPCEFTFMSIKYSRRVAFHIWPMAMLQPSFLRQMGAGTR
jgi:hypothetical protein